MAVLTNWIADLPTREIYFLQENFTETLLNADKYSILIMKFCMFAIGNTFLALTGGILGFKLLVSKESFPLFFEFHLILLEPNNWPFYLINLLHQLYALAALCFFLAYAVCLILTFLVHVLVHLEAISLLVGNMDEGIKAGSLEEWLRAVSIEVKHLKM